MTNFQKLMAVLLAANTLIGAVALFSTLSIGLRFKALVNDLSITDIEPSMMIDVQANKP